MYDVDYHIEIVGGTKSGESSPEMIAKVKKIAEEMDFFKNIKRIPILVPLRIIPIYVCGSGEWWYRHLYYDWS